MVRRRLLTPATAMPHATHAWPQTLPRGPCEAQPHAYHSPDDFHRRTPDGRTERAGNPHLLGHVHVVRERHAWSWGSPRSLGRALPVPQYFIAVRS